MGEFIVSEPYASFILDVVWQSSLFLLAGLAGGFIVARRPARAHRILLLGIAGALITPLCGQLARVAGWGLWTTNPPDAGSPTVARSAASTVSPAALPATGVQNRMTAASRHAMSSVEPLPDAIPPATATTSGSAGSRPRGEARSGILDRLSRRAIAPIRFPNALISLWCALSGLLVVRLVMSLIRGHRLVGRARPIACQSIEHAAGAACQRLGLRVRPELRASSDVDCPAIWCWGRRPAILLPAAAEAAAAVDWLGVFCHELAHWVRRDQWSSLLGEVLVCALPWHPLSWWAKLRLGQQSELACDDWAIASGQEPAAYAETLLELVPRRRMTTSLAAVSRRSGLAGRITHILDANGAVEPRLGRSWSGVAALSAIGLVVMIALAQARASHAGSDDTKKARNQGQPAAIPAPAADQMNKTRDQGQSPAKQATHLAASTHREVRGSVRDASDRPIAGARIFAVSRKVLAQVSSDGEGRFTLDLPIDPAVEGVDLVAQAAGMGLTGRNFSIRPNESGRMWCEVLSDQPVELTLSPSIPIEGRLLSPAGAPVPGVSVSLASLSHGNKLKPGWAFVSAPGDDEGQPARAPYWPEPAVTDSEGRFRLDGFSAKGNAEITIIHDDYVHESLTISTEAELSGWHKQWGIKPVAPRFTHVLEPARPVEGVVTDNDTGRPIAGANIEMAVSRAPDWRFHFRTTTDAKGHYRIIGVAWNRPRDLYTNVTPATDSGYLPMQEHREEWPAGVKELRWNFTLKKGRLVKGRVIEADTRKPIAGALVTGEYDSHKVLTDAQGNFALSINLNHRSLFVEGPTPVYQRVTVPRGELKSSDNTFYPHGYARIADPKQGPAAPVEIALKKGATIAAQAVDPEGKPLADVVVSGRSLYAWLDRAGETARHYATGLFRMSSFVPGQTYRILFIQDDRHLAGLADLTARSEPADPVHVTLGKMATVRGKLLRPDGSPDRGKRISLQILMAREEVKLDPMFFFGDNVLSYGLAAQRERSFEGSTGDKGEFEVSDLVAGVKHYLCVRISSNRVEYYPIDPLQPGEIRDLGAIKPLVLTERQP